MQDEFKLVPLALIFWKSPIRDFTGEDVENMAASLRVHGQLQCIITRPPDQTGRFEGVIGRLRFEGAKHAHLPTVQIRIHKFSNQAEILEWQLIENLHRKKMTALEKAAAYGQLARYRKKQFSEESVVQGISTSIEALTGTKPALATVKEYLQIDRKIKKEARLKDARATLEKVGIKHLRQISRIEDQNKQAELLLNTARNRWTVGKLRKEVDQTLGVTKPKPQWVDTGLKVTCPRCQETLEIIHMAPGRHTLKKVTGSR